MRMRGRFLLLGFVGVGVGIGAACIPHPTDDFEDYQERIAPFAAPPEDPDASFEAGPPPTEASEGLYYGACLSQLAFGRMDRVFSFYTKTSFVPAESGGGSLVLSLQPMRLTSVGEPPRDVPPTLFSESELTGQPAESPAPASPNVEPTSRWAVDLGTVEVPGDANPITGRPVVIENTRLTGQFGTERFCARLNGDVKQPVELTLTPSDNICQFYLLEEGDAVPTLVREDFNAAACPY
jgi:hypothetical protein